MRIGWKRARARRASRTGSVERQTNRAAATVASRTGLTIPENLTFDEWMSIGRRLFAVIESTAWALGDWLAYGEWRYGEKYRVALEEFSLKLDRVRDYSYVAANVPHAVRDADLSWRHHRVVAKLIPEQQERWLARAKEEGWSYRELEEEIAARAAIPGSRDPDVPVVVLRVSVPADREQRWEAAAKERGLDVSDWLVAVADEAASAAP